jgi:hypothetical protein
MKRLRSGVLALMALVAGAAVLAMLVVSGLNAPHPLKPPPRPSVSKKWRPPFRANARVMASREDVSQEPDLTAAVRRGRSWRTRFLALGVTPLTVATAVIVMMGAAFAAYYLAK